MAFVTPSFFRELFLKYLILFMLALSTASAQVTDFYVWRHGETEANKLSVLSGGAPELHSNPELSMKLSALNEQGKQQAKELGERIVNQDALELDVIYTSDLSRAFETAKAVVQAYEKTNRHIELHKNLQLREILHGKFELTAKQERDEAAQRLIYNLLGNDFASDDKFLFWKFHPLASPEETMSEDIVDVSRYLAEKDTRPETIWQLYKRATAELIAIAKENPGKRIGISTHGAFLCVLFESPTSTDFQGTYLAPYYNSEKIQFGNKVIPASVKVKNCDLMHFQYNHETNQLLRIDN